MSEVGGLIKLSYRGFLGFIVLLIMFVFGVTGSILSLAGGLLTSLSWTPLIYPEILENGWIWIGSVPVTDPVFTTVLVLATGMILLVVGFILLVLTYFIGKGAIIVDKGLARSVDRIFSRAGRGDRVSQLERLAVLLDRGMITPKEYEHEKTLIIGQSFLDEAEKPNDDIK
jgi:hypothetical protein